MKRLKSTRAPSITPDEKLRVAGATAPRQPSAIANMEGNERAAMLSVRMTEATLEALAAHALEQGTTQRRVIAEALAKQGVGWQLETLRIGRYHGAEAGNGQHDRWHLMCPRCIQLAKAEFEEFVWRDKTGVRFANRMPGRGRFLDRHWPVFRRTRRRVDRRRPSDIMASPCGQKVNRSILKSSQVCSARHWLPCNPLFAHAMQVEDTWRERRRTA